MSHYTKFPVSIYMSNQVGDIEAGLAPQMCQVFDVNSEIAVFRALCKQWLHVIAYDADGVVVDRYTNG